jgi:hypothetical protein
VELPGEGVGVGDASLLKGGEPGPHPGPLRGRPLANQREECPGSGRDMLALAVMPPAHRRGVCLVDCRCSGPR